MAYTVSSVERLKPDDFFQVAEFAFRPANLQAFTVAANRNTSGIVSAILKTPETIQNHGNDPLLANIPDNSAHLPTPS
jgi:hypothetical protein